MKYQDDESKTLSRSELTRQRLLKAAVACVRQWGVDKTTLNDIAREAGVTRPTVYAHFDNREAVLQAAMLQSAYSFAEGLHQQMRRFDDVAERVVESFVYCLEQLPKEPELALISDQRLATIVNQQALSTAEGRAICRALFTEMLAGRKELLEQVDEIAEFTVRLLLSMLTIRGGIERDASETRAFLRRRLLPALGLG